MRSADLFARLNDATSCLYLQNTDWPTYRIVGEKTPKRIGAAQFVFSGHDLRPKISNESANCTSEAITAEDLLTTTSRFPFNGDDPVPSAPPDSRATDDHAPTRSDIGTSLAH